VLVPTFGGVASAATGRITMSNDTHVVLDVIVGGQLTTYTIAL
jgi:hypothetical protein